MKMPLSNLMKASILPRRINDIERQGLLFEARYFVAAGVGSESL